jgi:hypothetical protein
MAPRSFKFGRVAQLGLAIAGVLSASPVWTSEFQGADFFGAYRVVEVIERSTSGAGSICTDDPAAVEKHPNAQACGKKIWLIRNQDQLAMVEAPATRHGRFGRAPLKSFLLLPKPFRDQCKPQEKLTRLKQDFSTSLICKAQLTPASARSGDAEKFYYSQDGEGSMKGAYEDAVVTGAVTGMPVGASVQVEVVLPRGGLNPDRVKIKKTLSASVLFIPTTLRTEFILERVSE